MNTEIKHLYDLYLKTGVVSTDSRKIIPGCLYFALKGDNFNGNDFALSAIEKGAEAAIVDENINTGNKNIIRVDNVLATLQQLAAYHRQASCFTILAITGSNGKTTTKELCREILEKKYKVQSTAGNLNNHIGVPLTLLSMHDIEIGIIEMGANHPGEIAALCSIAAPDYGLITNIGKAHLEGFGGIEGVAKAKGELFDYLIRNKKTIFLNEGNTYLPKLIPAGYSKIIGYNGNSGLRLKDFSCDPLLNLSLHNGDFNIELKTNLVGSYNIENIIAACIVGIYFGINKNDISQAITSYFPQNNRSQLIKTEKNTIFMDAYNANPSSMSASIKEFLRFNFEKKLLILGEMREVGNSSSTEHEEIIAVLKKNKASNVVCIGKAFEKTAGEAGFKYAESVEMLNEILKKDPLQDHFIFVKGSRSNRLEMVIPFL